MTRQRRVAVVGGGWAGISAAVAATERGHAVQMFEMAPQLGGRARSVDIDDIEVDNGQHIGIGAYTETLALMRRIGVDPAAAFLRTPLRLIDASGVGLSLRPGPPALAFAAAVLRHPGWRWSDKLGLLAAAARWTAQGFRCDPAWTVGALTAGLAPAVRATLIAPLCVAALNTEAHEASGAVFLRVLKDALFAGPGASDLLLPRWPLGRVLPLPALAWLRRQRAQVHLGRRVHRIEARAGGWHVDDEEVDAVVLATTAVEASRLTAELAPEWSRSAAGLAQEPIVTCYLRSAGARLRSPMLTLESGADAPAQFVFDRGQLGGPPGLLAFVVSGARAWVERGSAATWDAVERQARAALDAQLAGPLQRLKAITEQRATFRCVPALVRPVQQIAPGLYAAADFVDGPYPATLEGAVRSGLDAIARLT